MAPPRQRPAAAAAANLDDSRSEASSTRERQPGAKGRKAAAASKDTAAKPTSFPANPDPAAHRNVNADNNASISWSTMPLSVLHEYRHVYNLPSPSAYSSQINSIVLSQGIGLLSPTAIAARRAQQASSAQSASSAPSPPATTTLAGKRSKVAPDTDAQSTTSSTKRSKDGNSNNNLPYSRATSLNPPGSISNPNPNNSNEMRKGFKKQQGGGNGGGGGLGLHRVSSIPAQGRVSKNHLATAVRKHFNNTAISEQDAIARFLYKVNEERKGREFRLRFQP